MYDLIIHELFNIFKNLERLFHTKNGKFNENFINFLFVYFALSRAVNIIYIEKQEKVVKVDYDLKQKRRFFQISQESVQFS